MSYKEKLIEGKYSYKRERQVYSQENFKVLKEEKPQGHYFFMGENLTRVKTGEFLKIYVEYELTHNFDPVNVTITRLLGQKESSEHFHFDQQMKQVFYTFDGVNGKQKFDKIVTGKPHVATPCFFTSMLMINMKKLDHVHRTPYIIITTNNIWDYEKPFEDKQVFIELQDHEPVSINIGGNELKASHCKILQQDENGIVTDQGYDVYVSKHYSIPYKAEFHSDMEIEVEMLKNYESKTRGTHNFS